MGGAELEPGWREEAADARGTAARLEQGQGDEIPDRPVGDVQRHPGLRGGGGLRQRSLPAQARQCGVPRRMAGGDLGRLPAAGAGASRPGVQRDREGGEAAGRVGRADARIFEPARPHPAQDASRHRGGGLDRVPAGPDRGAEGAAVQQAAAAEGAAGAGSRARRMMVLHRAERLLKRFREASEEEQWRILNAMTPLDLAALDVWFEFWAHKNQLPPNDDGWRVWLMMAGRGFGKTRAGAEWIHGLANARPKVRIALVGATISDARSIMVEGVSGLLSVAANYGHRLSW